MEITARSSFIITSARKLRLVADGLRGLNAEKAMELLKGLDKRASNQLEETLNQAISNAKNNHHLNTEDLMIKRIEVNSGPTYKRFQPVSKGSAHAIAKRTSHLIIVLESPEKGEKGAQNGTKS
jgi:large subunit ribosomal protein L22